jgi:NAD+ synthase (glutamine-hydrolysing)
VGKGYTEADVKRVLRLVDLNEYKRRQSPIGVRLTQRGFGRDRRYPITNGWPLGE